ncbi:MAG: hypothetical protein ACI9OE_001028 [Mariniflexile sp.]
MADYDEFVLFTQFFLYISNAMIIQNKRIFISSLFVLISFVCSAQAPPPPGTPPPPGFLIDGGVLLGVCIGLFYGTKKLVSKKKTR